MAVTKMKRMRNTYLHGSATHRRTQSDYMATLLDKVTLETWGEVIDATVEAAKQGDASARTWLASYLMGRATSEAPPALNVMVQAFRGDDALVEAIAEKETGWEMDDDEKADVHAAIAAELPERIQT